MRSFMMVCFAACLIATMACSDPAEPGSDAGGMDATAPNPDADTGSDGALPELDARSGGEPDAIAPRIDADVRSDGGDSGALCAARQVCYERDTAGVACGDASICGGETPLCCRNDYTDPIQFECVATDRRASCVSGAPIPTGVALSCDEAADCQPGEICVDNWRKGAGVGRTDGARCLSICAFPAPFGIQVCRRDCECEVGAVCREGYCATP